MRSPAPGRASAGLCREPRHALDEPQDFVALGHHGGRQIPQQFKNRQAAVQACTSQSAHHERVHHDGRSFQQIDQLQIDQLQIAPAEVIDPHGRVDQNHTALPWRLRGAAFKLGCVPPVGPDVWRFRVR